MRFKKRTKYAVKARITRSSALSAIKNDLNDSQNPSSSSVTRTIPIRTRACKTANFQNLKSAKKVGSSNAKQMGKLSMKPKPVIEEENESDAAINSSDFIPQSSCPSVNSGKASLSSGRIRTKRNHVQKDVETQNAENERAKLTIKRARKTIQFTKNVQPHREEEAKPDLWNEIDSFVEVKEEEVDEMELITAQEDDIIFPPLNLECDSLDSLLSERSQCLICSQHDPDPRPLKGLLPKSKRLKNPEHLEDDLRIIYVLKMIFQWSTTELSYLMKHSNGQSPRQWIHLCQSCRLLVFEIQTLENRMLDCRKKIRNKIMKTEEMSSSVPVNKVTLMTRRIRSLVNQQVRSARNNNVFIVGDRKAGELMELEMNVKRNQNQASPLLCSHSEGDSSGCDQDLEGVKSNVSPCLSPGTSPCRRVSDASLPQEVDIDIKPEPSNPKELLDRLHLLSMSSHVSSTKERFACEVELCLKEFSTLKEFLEHATFTPLHSVTWNIHAEYLFTMQNNQISCGLCLGSKDIFESVDSFISHLKLVHSLSLKWEGSPVPMLLDRSLASVSVPSEINNETGKQMERKVCGAKNEVQVKSMQKTTFTCPACPNLEKMNLDFFLTHLIFHWRRPIKCTSCKSHLPAVPEAIDEHWQQHHPDLDSSTEAKIEPVQSFAGKVFSCEKCPGKFQTFQERNEHERSSQKWHPSRSTVCSVCKEGFMNTDELRLHRAIDHPEIASFSCYYCDELFPAESLEGVQYLDCEALKQHCFEKEDHPKECGKIFHLYACDLCGEVIKDYTRKIQDLKLHYSQNHANHDVYFSCFICHKGFVYESKWSHLANTHGKNTICDMCGEEMRPSSLPLHSLQKHDVLMEGCRKYACDQPGCVFVTVYFRRFLTHLSSHQNDKERHKQYKCKICEEEFFTHVQLKEHMEQHQDQPSETRQFQCEICGDMYANHRDLQNHRSTRHNLGSPAASLKKRKCDHCDYVTGKTSNFKRHIKRVHMNELKKPTKIVCCFGCSVYIPNLNQFDKHLITAHSMNFEKEHHIFNSKEEFDQWRDALKERESSFYAKWTNKKGIKILLCNRSSLRAPPRPRQRKNLRKTKAGGSVVSDKVCRSRIVVKIDKNDGTWKVTLHKTHTGHDIKLRKVGLSDQLQRKIAEDLINGATRKQTLNRLKEGEYGDVARAHLINLQDIYNICKKFNLSAPLDIYLTSNKRNKCE